MGGTGGRSGGGGGGTPTEKGNLQMTASSYQTAESAMAEQIESIEENSRGPILVSVDSADSSGSMRVGETGVETTVVSEVNVRTGVGRVRTRFRIYNTGATQRGFRLTRE